MMKESFHERKIVPTYGSRPSEVQPADSLGITLCRSGKPSLGTVDEHDQSPSGGIFPPMQRSDLPGTLVRRGKNKRRYYPRDLASSLSFHLTISPLDGLRRHSWPYINPSTTFFFFPFSFFSSSPVCILALGISSIYFGVPRLDHLGLSRVSYHLQLNLPRRNIIHSTHDHHDSNDYEAIYMYPQPGK